MDSRPLASLPRPALPRLTRLRGRVGSRNEDECDPLVLTPEVRLGSRIAALFQDPAGSLVEP